MWWYYDDRGLCTSFQSQDDDRFHQVSFFFFFFFFFFAQEERPGRHAGRPGSIDMVRGGACLRTQIYAVCMVSSGLPFLSMTPQPYWIAWRRRIWKVSPPVGDNLMEENDTKKWGSGRGGETGVVGLGLSAISFHRSHCFGFAYASVSLFCL